MLVKMSFLNVQKRYEAYPLTTINNCDYFCSELKPTEMPELLRPPYLKTKSPVKAQRKLSKS